MKVKKALTILICTVIGVSLIFNTNSGSYALGKEPIEIISKRSEYEKHFDNGDGTITAFVNTAPLHYSDNGEWKEIDNTLIPDNSGNYVNKNNSMKVTLSSETSVKSINTNNSNQMVCINKNGYTISWDIVDLNNKISILNNSSEIKIENDDCVQDVKLGNKKLNAKAGNIVNKLDSSISYDSIYNNIDLNIDIEPSSVKETIVLNSRNSVKEKFTFFIKADNLEAKLMEDGSISFYPLNGETVFKIPPAFMFDSSANTEYNYDIETNIKKCMDGYLLTLIPSSEWINDSNRVYPIMIDPTVETVYNTTVSTLSEAAPGNHITGSLAKIGGSTGNRYEALVACSNIFSNYSSSTVIKDAKFNMYFPSRSNEGNFNVYSINQNFMPYWNNCGGNNGNTTKVNSQVVNLPTSIHGLSFDVTNLVQSWLNYNLSEGHVGIYAYGLKISSATNNSPIFDVCSNSTGYPPYFKITYKEDNAYTLTYAPYKYNNIGSGTNSICNFQNKMNCYAYALQVYYRNLNSQDTDKLYPGEIGIGTSMSAFSTSELLKAEYKEYQESIQNCVKQICMKYVPPKNPYDIKQEIISNINFRRRMSDYSNFIQEQMECDAEKMNFSITKIDINDGSNFSNLFDEENERIIAMITYYIPDTSGNDGIYSGKLDCHFYLRNGNGTCQNGDGGNCSQWSHKLGTGKVLDGINNLKFCDANINNNASKDFSNESDVRYYKITKDTNIYNSWYREDFDQ